MSLKTQLIAVKFNERSTPLYGPLYPETSWVVEPGSGTFVRVHCSVALDVITLGMFGRVVLVTHVDFQKARAKKAESNSK